MCSLLLAQAESAPEVARTISKANFEARLIYLKDDSLLLNNDVELVSPIMNVVDKNSGKELQFSTRVLRGGFLFGLLGHTADGTSWPKAWSIDYPQAEVEFDSPRRDWLRNESRLQSPEALASCVTEVFRWAGGDVAQLSEATIRSVDLRQAAGEADVKSCEERLQVALPTAYREFLALTNGLSIRRGGRPYEILGLGDLGFIGNERRWLGITPLHEEGFVVRDVNSDTCFIARGQDELVSIGDFKKHVRESIGWEIGEDEATAL